MGYDRINRDLVIYVWIECALSLSSHVFFAKELAEVREEAEKKRLVVEEAMSKAGKAMLPVVPPECVNYMTLTYDICSFYLHTCHYI